MKALHLQGRPGGMGFGKIEVLTALGLVAWTLTTAEAAAKQASVLPTRMAAPLVFDNVTVVDVERGQLLRDQRVVVVGNRIQAMGDASTTKLPKQAQVVDAKGKYLIPGLWDMHMHAWDTPSRVFYPNFILNGVTGIRLLGEPSSGSDSLGLDSLLMQRREVAAGARIGPRIIGTGRQLTDKKYDVATYTIRVTTRDEARRAVKSLKEAGADFIKTRMMSSSKVYFAIASEARQAGIPMVGHPPLPKSGVTVLEASDSGQRSVEHMKFLYDYSVSSPCWREARSVEEQEAACAAIVSRFVRNGTWFTPTLTLENYVDASRMLLRAGVPVLAGTDMRHQPGTSLHKELALLVRAGLTPVEALRAATLNPAKFLRGTDSLGSWQTG